MKQITIIFFVIFLSCVCNAQSNNDLIKDSSKFFLNTFKFNLPNKTLNNNLNVPSFDFKSPTRFTLYNDTLNKYQILYDNYRHEYKPIQPYGNFGSALLGGTLNCLIMLFEKK